MIDINEVVESLCAEPNGAWRFGSARDAWEQLEIAAERQPADALTIIARIAPCLTQSAASRVAAKILRTIVESRDRDIQSLLETYESSDERMRQLIGAVRRYAAKVRLLRAILEGEDANADIVASAPDVRLPNAYGGGVTAVCASTAHDGSLIDANGDVDDVFDSFDMLVSNDPVRAWRMATFVAERASTDRDRLIVAQAMSRLINLDESVVRPDCVDRLRSSRALQRVFAQCRYAVSEVFIDELVGALSPLEK